LKNVDLGEKLKKRNLDYKIDEFGCWTKVLSATERDVSGYSGSGVSGYSGFSGYSGLTAITGLLDITNNGKIRFPATQSASTGANDLDDYEEGTFTPAVSCSGGNGTLSYNTQDGRYTKVGRKVTLDGYVNINPGTAAGSVTITGLPFTCGKNTGVALWVYGTVTNIILGYVGTSSAVIYLSQTYGNIDLAANNCGNPTGFIVNVSYFL
jgi:hypothetical protein